MCGRKQFKRMIEVQEKGVARAKEELNIVNIIKNARHLAISAQCSTLLTNFRKEKIQHTLENLILLDQERPTGSQANVVECINEDEIDFQIIKKVLHDQELVEIQLEEEEEEEEAAEEVDWDRIIRWSQKYR